jgi:hypothetical protein
MSDSVRISGKTTSEEVTADQRDQLDEQINPELPDERERKFQRAGFSRPKMEWTPEQRLNIVSMHQAVNDRLLQTFEDAYRVMHELFELIREPVMVNGEVIRDRNGNPEYRKTAAGLPVEDWGKLTSRERERFLYLITTRLFVWEQRATEAWAESMYAKVEWEMSFSDGFAKLEQGQKDTIEGRTAQGKLNAREDHYMAIFVTYYSRKADSLVRSMERLSQRLKDIHVAN